MSGPGSGPHVPAPEVAHPALTGPQRERLRSYGSTEPVDAGTVLFRSGDASYDFFLLEDVSADVVREATPDSLEALVGHRGPGEFLGELGLLTGQTAYLPARVTTPAR